MRWDSIKSRLLLMTTLCVLGMGLMTINQHYFGQKLSALNEQNVALQQMQTDLLQLRRHEKDYLLRHDRRYIEQFREQYQRFIATVNSLEKVIGQYELPANLVSDIAVNSELYARDFYKLTQLMEVYGLTADTGINGELRQLSTALNARAEGLTPAQVNLLGQATYLAADYQLIADPKTLAVLRQTLSVILGSQPLPEEVDRMLVDFRRQINRLVEVKQQIGLTEQQGLRGQFRQQAHRVEADLKALDNALQPVLVSHKEQATVFSTVIAVLTSIALILLLIKSFATFHRSFANFVLFFYRCKRQYQRIDPKQLGFSEFRSLAALANEMVESRRQIERRLAKLEATDSKPAEIAP